MSLTATNLTLGPATLYTGTFPTEEPADTAVNTAPAASAWTDVGATNDGVKLTVDQTYTELEVDQVVDRVGSRLTKRDVMVETTLAEPTLDNLKLVMNGGTTASGAGFESFEPSFATSATIPAYRALLFDGYADESLRRRVIVRRALSTDAFEVAYTKDTMTVLTAKWAAHYVSASIAPIHIVDATA
ncbi:phage tail tube protein [Streptomyces sp. MMBL 11-1]|uniref:phage tail tube protein n=1 Tax=Streptomyces sp. MMBL 11-1 TaxID=3026420 RepID=UPI00235F1C13|nr:hypothetical protein [Streptomyces sp. MMBL 11-1]